VYRAGLKYDKTGLIVKSESINDLGFTLGLGLPITGSFSNINFGFEMGKRGTTSSGLIQENYANLSIGLSLNDRWFERKVPIVRSKSIKYRTSLCHFDV
jgi:hypothetical protein